MLKRSRRSTLQGERPVSKSPFSRIPVSEGVVVHDAVVDVDVVVVGDERVEDWVLDVDVDVDVLDGEVDVDVDVDCVWDSVPLVLVVLREENVVGDEVDDADVLLVPVSLVLD